MANLHDQPKRTNSVVTCFLSCSVRARDHAIVDAVARDVLKPLGFRCFTIGRNASAPATPDEAIRDLLKSCDCMVGIATARLDAQDRDEPDRSLTLATPYITQEAGMAFGAGLPFLIMRTEEVTLQAISARNLWLTIRPELSVGGKVVFRHQAALVRSALVGLRKRAAQYRAGKKREDSARQLALLAKLVGGGALAMKTIEWLGRPDCFGDFYYRDPECRGCSHKARCKAEKALRSG